MARLGLMAKVAFMTRVNWRKYQYTHWAIPSFITNIINNKTKRPLKWWVVILLKKHSG